MSFHRQQTQLHACQGYDENGERELFIVEGISASKSVLVRRDPRYQAVLPMQGKPLNAIRASPSAVKKNPLFQLVMTSIGGKWDEPWDLKHLGYQRILLLFDPDADGIHCGVLMTFFFHQWAPAVIHSGALSVVRPPLFALTWMQPTGQKRRAYAYTESELHEFQKRRQAEGCTEVRSKRYRGLGGMPGELLSRMCLQPKSRLTQPITPADVEAMLRIFGPLAKAQSDDKRR